MAGRLLSFPLHPDLHYRSRDAARAHVCCNIIPGGLFGHDGAGHEEREPGTCGCSTGGTSWPHGPTVILCISCHHQSTGRQSHANGCPCPCASHYWHHFPWCRFPFVSLAAAAACIFMAPACSALSWDQCCRSYHPALGHLPVFCVFFHVVLVSDVGLPGCHRLWRSYRQPLPVVMLHYW